MDDREERFWQSVRDDVRAGALDWADVARLDRELKRRRQGFSDVRVPWLPEPEIEARAAQLLARYLGRRGERSVRMPIPEIVGDVVYGMEPATPVDLRAHFADLNLPPDTLGAVCFGQDVAQTEVYVDDSLQEDEHRWRWTVVHESCAHVTLHRQYYPTGAQLEGLETSASILCRSNQSQTRGEWQANCFTGFLLMPRDALRAAWRDLRNPTPLVVEPGQREYALVDWSPLVEAFDVSRQALTIQCRRVGLIADANPIRALL